MVAVPAALMLTPLSLSVVVLLIAGIPMTEAAPVLVAALTAFLVTHGLGLIGQAPAQEGHHEAAGAAPEQTEGEG